LRPKSSGVLDLLVSSHKALEIDGIASILDLVHEGFGYAMLPIHALRAHRLTRNLVATSIANPKLTIQLSLVASPPRPSTPLTRGLPSLARKTALQVMAASKPQARALEVTGRTQCRSTSYNEINSNNRLFDSANPRPQALLRVKAFRRRVATLSSAAKIP
jgi:hypothetical protein